MCCLYSWCLIYMPTRQPSRRRTFRFLRPFIITYWFSFFCLGLTFNIMNIRFSFSFIIIHWVLCLPRYDDKNKGVLYFCLLTRCLLNNAIICLPSDRRTIGVCYLNTLYHNVPLLLSHLPVALYVAITHRFGSTFNTSESSHSTHNIEILNQFSIPRHQYLQS